MLLRCCVFVAAVVGGVSSSPVQHFGAPAFREKTLTTFRRLDGDADNGNEDVDYSWMNEYAIKFIHCFRSETFSEGNVYEEDLVLFRLCPRDRECGKDCSNGADYVVDLNVFVDAFTEADMQAHEYKCEMARENCEGADDEDQCYQNYGVNSENCEEKDFNLQEYVECNEYEDYQNGKDNENGYYVGPYCSSDGENIYLGYFADNTCSSSSFADENFYDTYGYSLEYSEELQKSIIDAGECASCKEFAKDEDNNEGDQADEDDVIEQCEELYAGSGKCEEEIEGVDEMSTDACEYISELRELAETGETSSASMSKASRIGIGILLGLLALAVIMLGYWVFKLRHKERNKPKLSSQAGNLA